MTHKSRLSALGIDSQVEDIEEANLFWSQALGYACTAEEDSADKYADLQTPSGQLDILVPKVEHPSRVHLDLETDDKEAEVARLVALGAREVERFPSWIVMEAPTGHRFCVVNPQRADFHTSAEVNEWS